MLHENTEVNNVWSNMLMSPMDAKPNVVYKNSKILTW